MILNPNFSHNATAARLVLTAILNRVATEKEMEVTKVTQLTNLDRTIIYSEVRKTIYIADKSFFKEKKRLKNRD